VVSIALVAVSFAEVGVRAFIQQKQQAKVNSTPVTSTENTSLPQSSATVYDDEDMSPWRDPIVL